MQRRTKKLYASLTFCFKMHSNKLNKYWGNYVEMKHLLNHSVLRITGYTRLIQHSRSGEWLLNALEDFKSLFQDNLLELHLTMTSQFQFIFPSSWFTSIMEKFGSFNPYLRIYLNEFSEESGPWIRDWFCKSFVLRHRVASLTCKNIAPNLCKNFKHYSQLTILEIRRSGYYVEIEEIATLTKLKKLELCLRVADRSRIDQVPIFEHLTYLSFECETNGNFCMINQLVKFSFPNLIIIEFGGIDIAPYVLFDGEDIPNCTTLLTEFDYIGMFNDCSNLKYLHLLAPPFWRNKLVLCQSYVQSWLHQMTLVIFGIRVIQPDLMGPDGLFDFLSLLITCQKFLKVISVQILGYTSEQKLKMAIRNWLKENETMLNLRPISLVIIGGYVIYLDSGLDQSTIRTINYLERKCGIDLRQGSSFSQRDVISVPGLRFLPWLY
ncbi:uncharacterized protein LOC142342793 isoform X2 [Convolutriloba macropyga]|uniref:uncharacterized protein LOC142342793 isoform X2 n=1 Tax=Convolutriloba macropyga TaxID=536237 RepID=UPI003F521220